MIWKWKLFWTRKDASEESSTLRSWLLTTWNPLVTHFSKTTTRESPWSNDVQTSLWITVSYDFNSSWFNKGHDPSTSAKFVTWTPYYLPAYSSSFSSSTLTTCSHHFYPLALFYPLHHHFHSHCQNHCLYFHIITNMKRPQQKKGRYTYTMMPYTSCIPIKNSHFS